VFETINSLPAKFPIDDDTGTIEMKLRRLIRNHEYEQYQPSDSDEKQAEREIEAEEHPQNEGRGDDFEITVF